LKSILSDAFLFNKPSDSFYWTYYVHKDYLDHSTLFDTYFSPIISKDSFDDIISYFSEQSEINLSHASDEVDFKHYCFELYIALYDSFDMMGEESEDGDLSKIEVFYQASEPVLESLKKDLPKQVGKVFEKAFKDEFENINLTEFERPTIDQIIDSVIDILSTKTIKGLEKKHLKYFK
jgi:hypothetical protein